MKRFFAILLTVIILISLCACGNDEATPTTQDPTNELTQTPTGDATQAPTEDATEAPTETPTEAPTEAPTEVPTQAPTEAPAGCTHNFSAATCTAAKKCTLCGVTEGTALGHSWKDATCAAPKTCTACGATDGAAVNHNYVNGACSYCGGAEPLPAIDVFAAAYWKANILRDAGYYEDELELVTVFSLNPTRDNTYYIKDYFADPAYAEENFGTYDYNGKTYYDLTFSGSMAGFEFKAEANGDVTVELMNDIVATLHMESAAKFVVVASNDRRLPQGTEFFAE